MGMSAFYGPTKTEEENFKVLSRAADMGVTFWDTADVYGYGHNEGTASLAFLESHISIVRVQLFVLSFDVLLEGQVW
jgi:aryl-alcohol dehydrogenase-like predicted oxidoreductase